MAVTGFILVLFVVGHMAGNLQIFVGEDAINRYGEFLQSNVELLWPVRIFLLCTLVLHVWSAAALSVENSRARPVAYAEYKPVGSTYASRTMLMSGLIVFAFVIYHILHYTVQVQYLNVTQQDFTTFVDPKKRHDIYKMMVVGFSNPWVSGFYILGVGLLCLHLSHGVSSMFHSIGWRTEVYRRFLEKAACIIGLVLFIGYISIPVAVLCGFGKKALM